MGRLFGLLLVLGCTKRAVPTVPTPTPTPEPRILAVSGYSSAAVHLFDETGAPVGTLAGVPGAQSVHAGPDGLLYVVAEEDGQVVRFDPETRARVDVAADGLSNPTSAVFGPDGALYIGGFASDDVMRLDGGTLAPFIPAGTGGLDGPDAGMLFLDDGTLIVPAFEADLLLRFAADGALLEVLAGPAEGMSAPRGLMLREGRLWVTNWRSGEVIVMDPDGANRSVFATHPGVSGITATPDGAEILLTSDQSGHVVRYDAATGERLGRWIDADEAGIVGATFLTWL